MPARCSSCTTARGHHRAVPRASTPSKRAAAACPRSTPTARARPMRSSSASTTPRRRSSWSRWPTAATTASRSSSSPASSSGAWWCRRVALHARAASRSAARPQAAAVAAGRAVAATGSPGSAPATPPTRSRPTTGVRPRGRASSPTPASRSASRWWPRRGATGCRSPRSPRSGSTARSARRTSRCGVAAALPALVPVRLRARLPLDIPSPPLDPDRRNDPVMKVLVTGSSGFIGGYVVEELLARGYEVVGIDNHSKYGKVAKSYDDAPATTASSRATARDVDLMAELLDRLRPLHRRRRHDRRDLVLPRLRLRPARHQRADHGRVVRRRHQGAPGAAGSRRSPT